MTYNLKRLFLIFGFLVFACVNADAGYFLQVKTTKSPVRKTAVKNQKIKAAKSKANTSSKNGAAQKYITWEGSPPKNSEGTKGLIFDRLEMGTITGEVMVMGINPDNQPVTLDGTQQAMIETFFKEGLSNWSANTANICGSKVQIKPKLTFTFIDSLSQYKENKNLLYVVIGANNIEATAGKVALGKAYPGFEYKHTLWTHLFEGVRGTGNLRPFTIVMADPELVAQTQYGGLEPGVSSLQAWKDTVTHEFGHALGLYHTYFVVSGKNKPESNEKTVGYMNYMGRADYSVLPEYIAAVMTRVFECRLDITMTFYKTKVAPDIIEHMKWDFTGTVVSKYTDVLTSEWAYFNGSMRTENSCTVPDPKTDFYTYLMCKADMGKRGTNANDIDFNIGERNSNAMFLWEKESAFPAPTEQELSVAQGDCRPPVTLLENVDEPILRKVSPNFLLGSDGLKTWMRDANVNDIFPYVKADDPNPNKMPDCSYGVFKWSTDKVSQSNKVETSPITVTSLLAQSYSGRESDVGTYKIETKMFLAPKSSGSQKK